MPATKLPYLPDPVLVMVLQRVPLQECLRSAALVQQRWRHAATAASSSIKVHGDEDGQHAPKWRSVQQWLARHGQHVTSLDLSHSTPYTNECVLITLQPLPCPKLQVLKLQGMCWTLTADGAGQPASALSACTGLTQLCVKSSFMLPLTHGLSALSALQQLRHLSLVSLGYSRPRGAAEVPTNMLPVLQQLTYLELSDVEMSDAILEQISCLPRLQHLCLMPPGNSWRYYNGKHIPSCAGVELLGQLSQLTALQLGSLGFEIGPRTTPGLSQLTGLSRLQLSGHFEPALFLGATQLRHLELPLHSRWHDAAAEEALLGWISGQKHLRQLQLVDLRGKAAIPGALRGPLTASSVLECLHLTYFRMPWTAWHLVFPEGRQLPQLRTLYLRGCGPREEYPSLFSQDDLERIVQCCPGLRRLDLLSCLQPGTPLAALGQLQHLDTLVLNKVLDCSAVDVAKLASLTSLVILESKAMSRHGVAELFALTRLQRLVLVMGMAQKRRVYTNKVGHSQIGWDGTDLLQQETAASQGSVLRSTARSMLQPGWPATALDQGSVRHS